LVLKRAANQQIGPSTRGVTDADTLERKSVVPKKLLMIDDQAGMAKKVGPIAAELGLAFKALDTALTAAEVFIDFRPDIVIFDMVIPKNEGLSVLNEIMTAGIPTRIVLTSNFGEREAERIAGSHGAERPLSLKKPFRRDELIELLKNILDE
jgi:DNA-binding NtrC family response regulator